jgi:hypothetical protein
MYWLKMASPNSTHLVTHAEEVYYRLKLWVEESSGRRTPQLIPQVTSSNLIMSPMTSPNSTNLHGASLPNGIMEQEQQTAMKSKALATLNNKIETFKLLSQVGKVPTESISTHKVTNVKEQ